MKHLQIEIQSWLEAGGTPGELARILDVNASTVSRLASGARGFTSSQREAIYEGFKANGDEAQGIAFVIADVRDRMPESVVSKIEIGAKRGAKKKPSSPREAAIQEMIDLLNEHDPHACDLAKLWYDVRKRA